MLRNVRKRKENVISEAVVVWMPRKVRKRKENVIYEFNY
jgi:hypothetical protein